jgi:CheY-like chemotaxis protein
MPSDRPKILIVDDDSGMRLTLEGIIEDEGYEVVSAASAPKIARKTDPIIGRLSHGRVEPGSLSRAFA